ncbi:hypothetical protein BD626DRAFT_507426, partial [Schizophyllum amplum]
MRGGGHDADDKGDCLFIEGSSGRATLTSPRAPVGFCACLCCCYARSDQLSTARY